MEQQRLLTLIDRYLGGKASPEEILEIENWYNSFDLMEGLPPYSLVPDKLFSEKTILQKGHF